VAPGNEAEIALITKPGAIIKAHVDSIVWAQGQGQMPMSGIVPQTGAQPLPPGRFARQIEHRSQGPGRVSCRRAIGQGAIYTEHMAAIHILRKVILRVGSYTNYSFPSCTDEPCEDNWRYVQQLVHCTRGGARLGRLRAQAGATRGTAPTGTGACATPTRWSTSQAAAGAVRNDWLASFADPATRGLVSEALTYNADLRAAAARVEQAAGYVKVAGAQLSPDVSVIGKTGQQVGR